MEKVLIELSRNLFFIIKEVVDVSGPLMMNLCNFPIVFNLSLGVHRGVFGILHLKGKFVEDRKNVLESFRSLFSLESSYFRHQSIIKLIKLSKNCFSSDTQVEFGSLNGRKLKQIVFHS